MKGDKACDIIIERANADAVNMGLNFNIRVNYESVSISKNYLTDQELSDLDTLNWCFFREMKDWEWDSFAEEDLESLIELTIQRIQGSEWTIYQYPNNMIGAKKFARTQYNLYRRREKFSS